MKKIKKSYLLIIIFLLIVSCSNPSTNPDNNNNNDDNTSLLKAVTSGTYTVQYGTKTSVVDVSDEFNLQKLWFTFIAGQDLYYRDNYLVKKDSLITSLITVTIGLVTW